MSIDIKDVITLSDNNEYGVVSKTIYDNISYYYLVDINNNNNIKFLFEQGNKLIELEDKKKIQLIIPKFLNEIKDIM